MPLGGKLREAKLPPHIMAREILRVPQRTAT